MGTILLVALGTALLAATLHLSDLVRKRSPIVLLQVPTHHDDS